jgi:hypothetical protein
MKTLARIILFGGNRVQLPHHLMKIMDDRVGRLLQDGRDYTKCFLALALKPEPQSRSKPNEK